MWKISLSIILLLSSCISGSAANFKLSQDLDTDQVLRIHAITPPNSNRSLLEQRVYSIPLLPVFCGYRSLEQKNEGGKIIYEGNDLDGLLFTLLYVGHEKGRFDESGNCLHHALHRRVLLGLLYHNWSECTRHDDQGKYDQDCDSGFSIGFGLFALTGEHRSGSEGAAKQTLKLFWIPIPL